MRPQGQIKTEMKEEMSTHLTTWFPVNGCNQFESLQDKNVRGLRKKSISGSTGAVKIISIAFWLLDSAKCEGGASFFHQQKWHSTIPSWLLVAGSTHFIEDCTPCGCNVFYITTSTLQILRKYRCFQSWTYIDLFYRKHLDTTLVFNFSTLIACS